MLDAGSWWTCSLAAEVPAPASKPRSARKNPMPEPESSPKKPGLARRVQLLEQDVAALKLSSAPRPTLSGDAIRAAVADEFDGLPRLRAKGTPPHLMEASPGAAAQVENAAWGRVAAKLAAQG